MLEAVINKTRVIYSNVEIQAAYYRIQTVMCAMYPPETWESKDTENIELKLHNSSIAALARFFNVLESEIQKHL